MLLIDYLDICYISLTVDCLYCTVEFSLIAVVSTFKDLRIGVVI